jgi:predicted Zn-dependent peptidase
MAMTATEDRRNAPLTEDEIDSLMAQVEKGQQLAGHFPSEEDLAQAKRVLLGEITLEESFAEIEAAFRR